MTHLKLTFVLFYNQIKLSEHTYYAPFPSCVPALGETNSWEKSVPLGEGFLVSLESML